MTWLWSSTIVRTKRGKNDEMVLIAQLLLESRTGVYLEWLANEVIMTTNKTRL